MPAATSRRSTWRENKAVVAYVLHLTASNIVLLMQSHKAMP
jgi:hypothetical protein